MTRDHWYCTLESDVEGEMGRAWEVDIGLLERTLGRRAGVSTWFLNCPRVHRDVEWWIVACAHLREYPGQKKPTIRTYPEATHEIIVFPQNPNHRLADPRSTDGRFNIHGMFPADACIQFHVPNDFSASDICRLCVEACCEGILIPNQNFEWMWHQYIMRTAEIYRDYIMRKIN